MTEQALLERARDFDIETLAAIYDQYSPGVNRYAMRLLGDAAQAEDCFSETFSRFLTALRLSGELDDCALNGQLTRLREQMRQHLQLMEQLHGSAPGDAQLLRLREQLQTRLRLVETGLADPAGFRNQVRAGQFDSAPGNPWTEESPTPGAGYGPGPGPGECLECTSQATGAGKQGQGGSPWVDETAEPGKGPGPGDGPGSGDGNPWSQSTPTPGPGYGLGPGDGACDHCTPQGPGPQPTSGSPGSGQGEQPTQGGGNGGKKP